MIVPVLAPMRGPWGAGYSVAGSGAMRCIRCLRVDGSLLSRSRALDPTHDHQNHPAVDASGIPAVADAMNRQSAVCPSVRNKARLWFLQSQTLRANRAGTPPLSTADRSAARNALTAQGGGSGHVAPPTSFRQCGDRVTGNCLRFLAVGGEQRGATDSDMPSVRLAAPQTRRGGAKRASDATGLPAFDRRVSGQECNADAFVTPSAMDSRFVRHATPTAYSAPAVMLVQAARWIGSEQFPHRPEEG